MLLFGSLMVGLLVFATLYKYWEVRKAARWLAAPGRVLSSQSRARKVRTVDTMQGAEKGADLEIRNFAEVTYEYQVRGDTYRNSRISIGEDLGDLFVEQKLARYPKGAQVRVFYNPDDPQQAVLERDAPEGVWRTMALLIGAAIVLLIAATFGLQAFADALRENLVQPRRALPVALLAAIALFVAAVARAASRQVEAGQSWPWVEGEIETSRVEAFHALVEQRGWMRWRRYFRPDLVYRYRVNGVDFRGSRRHFGWRLYASLPWHAQRVVQRYEEGSRVTVYYNPDNAADAVLDPEAPGVGLLGVLAALFAAAALYLAFG